MDIKQLAEKICALTGFGQALHANDILPDIKELVELREKEAESSARSQRDTEWLDAINKLMPNESKVSVFKAWEAKTYEEKMLVRCAFYTLMNETLDQK